MHAASVTHDGNLLVCKKCQQELEALKLQTQRQQGRSRKQEQMLVHSLHRIRHPKDRRQVRPQSVD
ncbi:hypothetical protein HanHA300_Chr05g0171781 [Helianthus annuus]|nr:hypothetical protein HanHA300_Chr05g0171781 [Helianthus annuus]KAJ0584221.1 hypothetical protein HanHA89_Chr05g0186041 [Helianthus annuus]KAJ0749890.1 hypothetical protein HanLR1_Chr05g0175441 [Helianthus annuus]